MNMLSRLLKIFKRKPTVYETPVIVESSGFSVLGYSVQWVEVVKVIAYKLDLLAIDTVRIRVTTNSGVSLEVDEDQPGFNEFMAALEAQFPTANGWRSKVILPAFERNEALLYVST